MMKRMPWFFLLNVMAVLLVFSCASKPKQELLDELNAAMVRAQTEKGKAAAVQGQAYFPADWKKAETDENAGRNANKNTVDGVKQGIAMFNSAADGYAAIAEKAGPLFAKDQDDARSALQAAMVRADKSRQDAQDNQGPKYFPDDWASAEAVYQNGIDAKKTSIEEMKAAAGFFNSAADGYDAITGKSRPLLAKEKDDANKALQAAMARADKSRQAAMDVDGQNYFPNDWKDAETKNTSGKNAKKTTVDEITAATALFVSAADAYDDIAKKSQPRFAKDKDDANKALQAAIARMDKSRKAVQDAQGNVNLPTEWNAAETKNKTASGAKRGTVTEIKAATPLYISAADAYDDILKKNSAFSQKGADDAKARAEQERQKALDAKADIAAAAEFGAADTLFGQAAKESEKKSFGPAIDLYNKSADQFISVTVLTEKKRALANQTIAEAKLKSSQSTVLIVGDEGDKLSEFTKGLLNNQYMLETLRLIGLAEDAYGKANYDDAVKYAQEAMKNAGLSDDYVAEQLKNKPVGPVLAAQYRVKTWNGTKDCLWNIAAKKEIYGDPFKWKLIYDANKNKFPIPGNPDVIDPGTVLDIPSLAGENRSGVLED